MNLALSTGGSRSKAVLLQMTFHVIGLFGYICDRILVGDLLDDADHDLFRKVCHSHHSLNLLLKLQQTLKNCLFC